MDEVDKIVLLNLKSFGLDFSEEGINGLADFKAEQVFACCVLFLKSILTKDAELAQLQNLPASLPRGMSQKVNATSELANLIKQNGYKGDLGYHQLMYPNVNDLRRLFMWLIDAMPKKPMSSDESGGVQALPIDETINRELNSLLQETWFPDFAIKGTAKGLKRHATDLYILHSGPLHYMAKGRKSKVTPGMEKYYTRILGSVSSQVNHKSEIAPSIFEANLSAVSGQKEKENEWNTKGLESAMNPMAYAKKKAENINKLMASILRSALSNIEAESGRKLSDISMAQSGKGPSSNLGRKRDFTTTNDLDILNVQKLSEEEVQKKREAEIEALQTKLSQLEVRSSEVNSHIKSMQSQLHQIEAMLAQEESKTPALEKEFRIKKTTYGLLPNAEKNIQQLQELSSQQSLKLIQLAQEWENHRIPLVNQVRVLRNQLANVKDEMKSKITKIKEIQTEIRSIAEEIRAKDEKYREMLEQYAAVQGQVARTYYTDRILEIVKSVKKQKQEIDKVLIDTRNSQKEINNITDTLNRTFLVTDELIYQDAKKGDNNTAKEAYKQTVGLNESFKKLVKSIEETGQTRNAILNLEGKIQQVKERVGALNFARVEQDLQEIREENQALMQKLAGGA